MSNKACETHTQATRPTAWGHVSCATCQPCHLPRLCLRLPPGPLSSPDPSLGPDRGKAQRNVAKQIVFIWGDQRTQNISWHTRKEVTAMVSYRWERLSRGASADTLVGGGERRALGTGTHAAGSPTAPRREACCTPRGLLHSGGRAQVQHTYKRPQEPAAPAEPQELRAEFEETCALECSRQHYSGQPQVRSHHPLGQ